MCTKAGTCSQDGFGGDDGADEVDVGGNDHLRIVPGGDVKGYVQQVVAVGDACAVSVYVYV